MASNRVLNKREASQVISSIANANSLRKALGDARESPELIRSYMNDVNELFEGLKSELNVDEKNASDILTIAELKKAAFSFVSKTRDDARDFQKYKNTLINCVKELESTSDSVGIMEYSNTSGSYDVKLSLTESAYKIKKTFNELSIDEASLPALSVIIKDLLSITAEVLKPWTNRLHSNEKYALISSFVSIASEIYMEEVIRESNANLSDSPLVTESLIWETAKQLTTVLENMDMGYASHDVQNIDWLKKEITQMYFSCFTNDDNVISQATLGKLSGKLKDHLEIITNAWISTANQYMSICDNMTEKEFNHWAENDGAKPMPLSDFRTLVKSELSAPLINLDFNIIKEKTKKEASFLWGVSDALFKVST
jgi:hypothetical protein